MNCIVPQEEMQQMTDECQRLQAKLQTVQEFRDGFEKSFHDTVSSLEALKNSHSLTRQAIKAKEAELTESQNAYDNMKKVLSFTRSALKGSHDEACGGTADLIRAKYTCHH